MFIHAPWTQMGLAAGTEVAYRRSCQLAFAPGPLVSLHTYGWPWIQKPLSFECWLRRCAGVTCSGELWGQQGELESTTAVSSRVPVPSPVLFKSLGCNGKGAILELTLTESITNSDPQFPHLQGGLDRAASMYVCQCLHQHLTIHRSSPIKCHLTEGVE